MMQRIVALALHYFHSLKDKLQKQHPPVNYKLLETFSRNNTTWLRVSMATRAKPLEMPAKFFFQHNPKAMEQFSKSHVAAITAAAARDSPLLLVESPTQLSHMIFSLLLLVQACLLISANLMSAKIMHIIGRDIVAGALCFPFTYSISEIITEFYGQAKARQALLMTLVANTLVIGLLQLSIYMPPATTWDKQVAYSQIFQTGSRGFIASMLAFALGDLVNIYCFAKLQRWCSSRLLFMRLMLAALIGLILDSILFIFILQIGKYPLSYVWQMCIDICEHKIMHDMLVSSFIAIILTAINQRWKLSHHIQLRPAS